MKFTGFKVFKLTLEMAEPFVTSLRRVEQLETIVIKSEADSGIDGWGEAPISPQVNGETTGSVLAVLDGILPELLGSDPRDRERIHETMDDFIYGNTGAKAGVDITTHDLLGKTWGVPLWKLLGGSGSGEVETDFTISLGDKEKMAQKAAELVKQGFNILKIKLGGEPRADVARMKEIDRAVDDSVKFRIDANQGWTRGGARFVLKELKDMKIEFVEQPLEQGDLEGMRELRARTEIPIMADESVHGPESARSVIDSGAADYINIKLSKTGGFWPALKLAALAESAGISCMVGGMSSTDLLATAASHLAAGAKVVKFADLDMGTAIKENVISEGGARLRGGKRVLGESNGLGIDSINYSILGEPVREFTLK